MQEEILLQHLEELAGKLEICVRCENISMDESSSTGGLCRVEGQYILILNSKADVQDKIQVMIRALQNFDLDEIYIKPAVRRLLDDQP
jgi:recombinational DNA repair protein RecR